jgi:hypothetical protein
MKVYPPIATATPMAEAESSGSRAGTPEIEALARSRGIAFATGSAWLKPLAII